MRILVTGGAGFIGSHLCECLLRRGDDVVIVDELNDFYSPELKRANLNALASSGRFTFYCRDICEADAMCNIAADHRPEVIVHLAARAGVRPSLAEPLLYQRVNVGGTVAMLEAARLHGVRKFVFASSSSIYGIANRIPFAESDTADLPISPYAATKIAGEKMCYAWSHLYDLSVICLRFFTVYGPRQRPDLAIRKFTDMIQRGNPIPVFGDGTSGRDYTFVDDTVAGIIAAIDYDCRFDIFNFGNSHPVNLNAMIATIEGALGMKAQILRLPDQAGDVPITYADISKAQLLLNYSPKTPFREGIEQFVEWLRANESEPTASMATAAR